MSGIRHQGARPYEIVRGGCTMVIFIQRCP